MTKAIGGFFALELPLKPTPSNFLTLWNISCKNSHLFHTSRSALHHLLQNIKPNKLWVPAYISPTIEDAAKENATEIAYYPITPTLSPDCAFLDQHVNKGDAVLVVQYYGRNPDQIFLDYVEEHTNITWIEDRVQAMLPADTSWGNYIIYSPRKLLGVPDGGILVYNDEPLPDPKYEPLLSSDFITASLLRYEDTEEEHNDTWYNAFLQYENEVSSALHPMSQISFAILETTNPDPIIARRKENYQTLMQALEGLALLPSDKTNFVPFGFPIQHNEIERIAAHLRNHRVFAPRYWPELPSNASEFAFEHELARTTLTLPCDHRYTKEDMEYIINNVNDVLS